MHDLPRTAVTGSFPIYYCTTGRMLLAYGTKADIKPRHPALPHNASLTGAALLRPAEAQRAGVNLSALLCVLPTDFYHCIN